MNKNKLLIAALIGFITLAGCADNSAEQAQQFIERSLSYESQGQYRAAMIELRNAINTQPENIANRVRYAEVLLTIGAARQAIETLEGTDNADANITLAKAYLATGKHVSAQTAIENSSLADGPTKQWLQAKVQYVRGDRFEAIRLLNSWVNSDSPLEAQLDLIQWLTEDGQLDSAQRKATEALTANAGNPAIQVKLAAIAVQRGNFTAAENYLTEALQNLPDTDIVLADRITALELMSVTLTQLGRPTEALIYNQVLRDINPEAFAAQQQYKDALSAAANGDLVAAKNAFEDILTQFPNNSQAAMLLGLVNLESGEVAKGEALLTENIDAETAPVSIIQATALAQAELGKTQEAIAVLERALLARPDDSSLLSLYGVISLNAGNATKGIQSLNKALQLDPERSRLHLLLAQYYLSDNQPEFALGHLRKAFAQLPADWATTGFYLNTLIDNGEQNEAQQVKQTLQTQYPESLTASWLVALADYRMGNTQDATERLASLYQQSPSTREIYSTYAAALSEQGQATQAANVWIAAYKNNPEDHALLNNALRAYSVSNSSQQTLTWLLAEQRDFTEARLGVEAAIAQLHLLNGSLAEAQALAKRHENNIDRLAQALQVAVYQATAIQHAQQQDFTNALTAAEKGLSFQPANQQLAILAAQFESRLNKAEASKTRLTRFTQAHENNHLVVAEMAKLTIRDDSMQAALDYMKPYWQQRPSGELANVYFAVLRELGDTSGFNQAVDQLLVAEPGNPGALVIKGDAALANSDEQTAITYYQQAINGNNNLVPALNNLAWLLAERDNAQALQYSQRAIALAPNNSAVLDTHGWVLLKAGNKAAAANYFQQALEIDPDNSDIQAHLAQAQ